MILAEQFGSGAHDTTSEPAPAYVAVEERRGRVRGLLAEQRRRLLQFEQAILLAPAPVASPIPAVEQDTGVRDAVERQQALLDQISQQLQQLEQVDRRPPNEPVDFSAERAEANARLERLQQDLALAEQRVAEERELAAQARRDVDAERQTIRELQTERQRAEEERRALIAESDRLREAANTQSVETSRLSVELYQLRDDFDRRLAEVRQTQTREFDEHLIGRFAQIEQLTADRDRLKAELQVSQEATTRLEVEVYQLHSTTSDSSVIGPSSPTIDPELQQEADRLRRENQLLSRRIAKLEEELDSGGNTHDSSDLQRRLELALQDVRELKIRNQELKEDLAKSPKSPAGFGGSGSYDWEAQKQKLLAQLESDFDESIPQQKNDKLTVQGAIRITDQIVADKDRELDELRRMLDQQAASIGEVAVGASAIAQFLDQDELIAHERENLKESQAKLQELLKTAEIDLSVERAKLARERSKLEEMARQMHVDGGSKGTAAKEASLAEGKGSRGKWLERLGLKDKPS